MAKRKTETVPVPTKRELSDAGRQLQKGHSSAGKVLSEQARAKSPPPPKKK